MSGSLLKSSCGLRSDHKAERPLPTHVSSVQPTYSSVDDNSAADTSDQSWKTSISESRFGLGCEMLPAIFLDRPLGDYTRAHVRAEHRSGQGWPRIHQGFPFTNVGPLWRAAPHSEWEPGSKNNPKNGKRRTYSHFTCCTLPRHAD